MRLLLDTHTFLWFVDGDESLSLPARTAIEDPQNEKLVSAASAWEITTKYRLGKLAGAAAVAADVAGCVTQQGFAPLPLSLVHAQRAGALRAQRNHKDPFDHMLIAQALAENLVLVSNEGLFDGYGVFRLW